MQRGTAPGAAAAEIGALLARAIARRCSVLKLPPPEDARAALAMYARVYGDGAAAHECSFNECRYASFVRGARYSDAEGTARSAEGVFFVCVATGQVHECTDEACDAVEQAHGVNVCRVTRCERQSVFNYTLGAARGHVGSGEAVEAGRAARARTAVIVADARDAAAKRRRLEPAPAPAAEQPSNDRPDAPRNNLDTLGAVYAHGGSDGSSDGDGDDAPRDEIAAWSDVGPRMPALVPMAAPGRVAGLYSGAPVPVQQFVARERERRAAAQPARVEVAGHARLRQAGATRAGAAKRAPRSDADFERAYLGDPAAKREEARRLVEALLFSAAAREARQRRHDAALARGDAAAIAYLTACAKYGLVPSLCALFERFARHVPTLGDMRGAPVAPQASATTTTTTTTAATATTTATPTFGEQRVGGALPHEPHLVAYYTCICTATWLHMCRSRAAFDPATKQHPSFSKHCIGMLYSLCGGFTHVVRVSRSDFAGTCGPLLAAAVCGTLDAFAYEVTFVTREDAVAASLPAHDDVDAVLRACGVDGDKKYIREGQNMLRVCYMSLIDEARARLLAALATLSRECEFERDAAAEAGTAYTIAQPIIDAASAEISTFFQAVAACEFDAVVGARPAPYEMLALGTRKRPQDGAPTAAATSAAPLPARAPAAAVGARVL